MREGSLVRPEDPEGEPLREAIPEPGPAEQTVFRAFDREGIAWCLLRGESDLGAPSGDVDLLVARRDFSRAGAVAEELGFVRVPSWGYGSHAFFLAYDPCTDRWTKLDVVTELAFGPRYALRIGAEGACLERRRRADGLSLLVADDAFWALLLHRLLDEGGIDQRSATRLRELAEASGGDGPLARVVEDACPRGWSAGLIVDRARRGDWAALTGLAPALARGLRRTQRVGASWRSLSNGTARRMSKLLVPFRRPGLSVALVAPDGAGKSTVADGLKGSFRLPARSIYMGLYRRGEGARSGPRVPGVGLSRRLGTQWARWLAARYHQARGRLVIFDRYSYDALLPPRHRLTGPGRARRWLLSHACPAPDLVLMLDAPGDVLYRRKGEHSEAVLEEQRRFYLELARRLPHAEVVDATRDAEQVRRDVTSLIWRAYRERWRRG